ncbi:unnamed protein product [Caretta caretta]
MVNSSKQQTAINMREFIDKYAEITKPLYQLLQKGQEWQWEESHQQAFTMLKQALAKAPTLAYPKPDCPYYLQLGTTNSGISTVLFQDQGTGLQPVAYGSRVMSEVERLFSACEREVLALVWALGHCEYLVGMSPVILRTSHTPVRYVLSGRVDIKKLQQQDPDVQSLLQKKDYKGYYIFKDRHGLIMALRNNSEEALPVLVLPSCLHKEMVTHQQSHFGADKTMDRIICVAW